MDLTGISCPTTSMCVAVDREGDVVTSTDPAGGSAAWKTTSIDTGNQLASVSCPSTSLCVGVDRAGNVVTSTNPSGGASAWNVANIDNHAFWSVSCPATSLCVAVGDSPSSVFTSTNPAGGAAKWSATTVTGLTQGLQTVSCPSTASCVALDGNADIVTSANPTGGTAAWSFATGPSVNVSFLSLSCTTSLCVAVGGSNYILTSTNPSGGAGAWTATKNPISPASLNDVACTSGGLCVASALVGGLSYGSLITTTTPAAGGPAWTEAPLNTTTSLFGVSCPSASLCFAVDNRGNALNSTDPTAGTAWNANNVTGTSLYGIACPSATLCVAVDYAGNILSSANPTGSSSAWTAASVDGGTPINAVACPSGGLCVAVDDAGNVLTSTDPTGGAGAWHSANIDGATPLGAIACASITLCVAGDDQGQVIVSTDPTGGAAAWHPSHIAGAGSFNGLSCPSTTLCVAVDNAGNVVTSTDPASGAGWSAAPVDAGNSLTAVSCSSPTQCVAVDDSGNEVNSIDPAGGEAEWTGTRVGMSPSPFGGPGFSPLQAISCPTESYCVAVDAYGFAFVGKPTPSNLTPPSIAGGGIVGQTLAESSGTWTDSPTSIEVSWERCDKSGADCSPINGASGQAYTLSSADLGSTVRAVELASNANGDGTPVESNTSTVVTLPALPAVISPPTISGNPVEGQTLSESHGAWTNSPTGYHDQWEDCDSSGNNCTAIAGATHQTHSLAASDVGHTIRLTETASNPGGTSQPTNSSPTGVVQVPAGTQGTVTLGHASVSGTSVSIPVSCAGGTGANCSVAAALTITETVRGAKLLAVSAAKRSPKPKKRAVTVGAAATTLTSGQTTVVTVALNAVGKQLLLRYRTLKLTLSISQAGRTLTSRQIRFVSKAKAKRHKR